MSNRVLVVGYYDELTHEKEMGGYNPEWDVDSIGIWVEQNPKVSEDDPDYKNRNQIRGYELSKQRDLRHELLQSQYLWTISRKRVFAIIETQTSDLDHISELDYVVEHSNNIDITVQGKQEHITEVATFPIGDWAALYISIYENHNFLFKVKSCQVDFASSIGVSLGGYMHEPELYRPNTVLYDITVRENTLFKNYPRTPVYDAYDYEPRYFHSTTHNYVQNTNFGLITTVDSKYGNNVKMLNNIQYPRNSDSYYQYELSNYVFNRNENEHDHKPLTDSLLETAGVNLLDNNNYYMESHITGQKLLLSSIFNLVNLLILDSFQHGMNERYYLTPSMKVLMDTYSKFDRDEIKKGLDEYYMYITGIIGAQGLSHNEIEGIIRQNNEVSFRVLKSIVLYSRVHWNHIKAMTSDIDDGLKSHEADVTETLVDDNVTDPASRYVMYDKLLITKSRICMESLFLYLSIVKI